ncbi:VOC family protein [Microlunatus antarcticus]|uniref:Catechol 2,3-dioxygenase n=1 Tax=Microlunatus antarcticus TaxID=53388 RepID=A0A7W5JVC5_9ACTN|nr:VOC family protein [Microlunatus antarcticus]MBB3327057.1 hypothetical protein [Microlunatus antarcticus]
MRLNHVNLCASDVNALTRTLEAHFSYSTVQSGTVPNYPGVPNPGTEYAMLIGDDGSDIVITQIDPPSDGESAYPPQFHFGLIQDTAQAVHSLHAELTTAGYEPGTISVFEVLGATWTAFYCPLGDGLEIEINHRTDSDLLDHAGAQQPEGQPS